MQGHPDIIRALNQVLFHTLTAINQSFLHAKMLKNWGLDEWGGHERTWSIHVMKDADALAERILFLEGLPNFQALGKLRIGEHALEILTCDLALQNELLDATRAAIAKCETIQDFVSRKLLTGVLDCAEDHLDWLETQLDLVDRVGNANYLQSQMEAA